MALLWRAVFQTDDDVAHMDAASLVRGWGSRKARDADFELPAPNAGPLDHSGLQFQVWASSGNAAEVWRATCFETENRPGEQISTKLTAFRSGDQHWLWVDIENWKDQAFRPTWLPYAPRLVGDALQRFGGRRGATRLAPDPLHFDGDEGEALASIVCAPDREVPVIVVTSTRAEREAGDVASATARAQAVSARLTGIALVAVLGTGAVSAFSRRMFSETRSADFDVHSGAIRTYLPFGSQTAAYRHRYVPHERLAGRDADVIARLVTPGLIRAACAQLPPPRWRALGLPLLEAAQTGIAAADATEEQDVLLADLIDEADKRKVAEKQLYEAEYQLEEAAETEVELLKQLDKLTAHNRRLRRLVADSGQDAAEVYVDNAVEPPDTCSGVVERATAECERLVFGDKVADGAQVLDSQNNPSWARKAWLCMGALQSYADAKAAGDERSLYAFIDSGGADVAIPVHWLAMKESATTDNNAKYRLLRTFGVPAKVAAGGTIYMPSHLKLEQGGTVAPRIHFYDDTSGRTGKVHVGWFGPHLENVSKN